MIIPPERQRHNEHKGMREMKSMTTVCRDEAAKHTPTELGWGFRFLVDTELEALRIGYAYRNCQYGYKIEWAEGVRQWSVTVWNERAKDMGCDV